MEFLGDEDKFAVETYNAPRKVESAVNAVWKGGRLVTPIGGGVEIEADMALDPQNHLTDEDGKLATIREAVAPELAPGVAMRPAGLGYCLHVHQLHQAEEAGRLSEPDQRPGLAALVAPALEPDRAIGVDLPHRPRRPPTSPPRSSTHRVACQQQRRHHRGHPSHAASTH